MWVRKARDEMENNDFEAARTSLSQAVQANTTYVDAYYQLANLERFEGNAFAAVQNYSRAIELNPELTAAYDGRASALLQIGDTVHAVADLEKVSKSGDPRRRAAADSLLNLVRRGVPPPATTRGLPPILVFYRDSADVATAKMVERTLDQAGYPASRPRRENLPFTHFTVRYFHREDQARADSIRRLVNRMLEALPVAPTVELLPLTEDYAPAGHLEVWVPGKAPLPVTPPAVTPSPGVDSTPPSSSVAPVTTPTRG
jgi:tetratricopeptide (TPR) repeat protein